MNNVKKAAWIAAMALASSPLAAETFHIDPQHSSVSFRVTHMMISKVNGNFDRFSGTVDYEKDKPASWKTQAEIDAASVDTRVEARDNHLRSPDFFDVQKYPKILFKSVSAQVKDGKTTMLGDLTIHGVTKRVALDLAVNGMLKSPQGQRLGATASGKISRKDFGLLWNKALESGGVVVGDDVEITLEIEAVAKNS